MRLENFLALTHTSLINEPCVNGFENIVFEAQRVKRGDLFFAFDDKEIDIATALAGSGPAFLALVAEAISDGGVLCGLNRELSYKLTKGLFRSFSAIDKKPADIKDSVMSPAGTTASGYEVLEEGSVRNSFIKAIKSAYEKSQKI